MNDIKAIETLYKGYKFRSRLEARWAVFFDKMRIRWFYEHEGYETSTGYYLPDFWLPDTWLRESRKGVLFEVKPEGFGNTHPQLEEVARKLDCGAILACSFHPFGGNDDEKLTQIAPWWDEPMTLYQCKRCRVIKFAYPVGSQMECDNCNQEDFLWSESRLAAAYEEALRYRFW